MRRAAQVLAQPSQDELGLVVGAEARGEAVPAAAERGAQRATSSEPLLRKEAFQPPSTGSPLSTTATSASCAVRSTSMTPSTSASPSLAATRSSAGTVVQTMPSPPAASTSSDARSQAAPSSRT